MKTQRCAALSLVFTPFFGMAKAFGIADMRFVWLLARLLQTAVSLVFVLATARLGTRLLALSGQTGLREPGLAESHAAGRLAGLAAGFLVACNPIFLRFCADPIAGLTAGTLVALGTYELLAPSRESTRLREVLLSGLYLGLAAIVSYKVLPLAAALFALSMLRDGWHAKRRSLLRLAGFSCALAIGCAVDRIAYGSWGLSLSNYLVYNLAVTAVPLLLLVGLRGPATSLYEAASRYYDYTGEVETERLVTRIASHPPKTWYLTHIDEFLVIPVIALLAVAALVSLRRPRWPTTILLASLLAFGVILSAKHSKSYRLFLPALPLIAALAGLGFSELWSLSQKRMGRGLGRLVTCALLIAALPLGFAEFLRRGPRLHGNFWQALDWVEAQREAEGGAPAKFASSHPFATLFRAGPELEHVTLQVRLQEAARAQDVPAALLETHLSELETLDWLLMAEHTLRAYPELFERICERFTLEAAFFEAHHEQDWGPALVFRRRRTEARGRTFFSLREQAFDPSAKPGLREFAFTPATGAIQTLWLTEVTFEELPGSGLGWFSSTWQSTSSFSAEFLLRLMIETPAEEQLELLDFNPGRLGHPTSSWPANARFSQGLLVGLNDETLERNEGWARVWAAVLASDLEGERLGPLEPLPDPRLRVPERKAGWIQVARILSAANRR